MLHEASVEVRRTTKAHPVGDLRNGTRILPDQVHGQVETVGTDELCGRLVGKGLKLAVYLGSAHAHTLAQLVHAEIFVIEVFIDYLHDTVEKGFVDGTDDQVSWLEGDVAVELFPELLSR